VNNGIARRSWARNPAARKAILRAMEENQSLKVTLPFEPDLNLIDQITLK
jgi:urocanate hydratase